MRCEGVCYKSIYIVYSVCVLYIYIYIIIYTLSKLIIMGVYQKESNSVSINSIKKIKNI